jgi:hypothetical protein
MFQRLINLRLFLLFCCLMEPSLAASDESLELKLEPTLSNDGKASLSWKPLKGTSVQTQLQQSNNAEFLSPKTRYLGSDTATVVTGLKDGAYHFRARRVYPDGTYSAWDPAVTLHVKHHSLTRAFIFFFIGATVFLATLLLIVFGARQQGVGR